MVAIVEKVAVYVVQEMQMPNGADKRSLNRPVPNSMYGDDVCRWLSKQMSMTKGNQLGRVPCCLFILPRGLMCRLKWARNTIRRGESSRGKSRNGVKWELGRLIAGRRCVIAGKVSVGKVVAKSEARKECVKF